MPLSRLLPDVAAVPPELAITGLVLDSRSIAPGDAFVAIGGFGTHGLHFVEQARAAGASAILFEPPVPDDRSEEHTSELQSLMRISYAVFCLKKKKHNNT